MKEIWGVSVWKAGLKRQDFLEVIIQEVEIFWCGGLIPEFSPRNHMAEPTPSSCPLTST